MFLKRYRGETNCQVTVLLDASRSMKYGSRGMDKLEYAQFLAASICYLAHLQRDAAGLIVFDERSAALRAAVHAPGADHAAAARHRSGRRPARETVLEKPFAHLVDFLRRRGLVVAISDFWENPETVIKTVGPLRSRGNELILFHVLDPEEIQPKLRGPVLLEDLETGAKMEVSPDYATHEYKGKMSAHLEDMKSRARGRGHRLFPGGHQPSAGRGAAAVSGDSGGEVVNGFLDSLVPGRRCWRWACRSGCICSSVTRPIRKPFPSLMFFEHREQSSVQHRRLDYILLFLLRAADAGAAGAAVRQSVSSTA